MHSGITNRQTRQELEGLDKNLVIDPETGYRQSPNYKYSLDKTFNAQRKKLFVSLGIAYIKETGKIPSLKMLADKIGVTLTTVWRHFEVDKQFERDFREILLHGEDKLVSVMIENAQRPSGYMDRITWLRRHFPERWHPENKIIVEKNINFTSNFVKTVEAEIINETSSSSEEPTTPTVKEVCRGKSQSSDGNKGR